MTLHPKNGESYKQLIERISHFYKKLIKKHTKETVLIVSHGGALTAFYLWLFRKSIEKYKRYHPGNTAVTILEIDDDKKHTVHILNCVKHLD